ncbi:MAG: phasin family protein [Vicinamibacterales bacterium]
MSAHEPSAASPCLLKSMWWVGLGSAALALQITQRAMDGAREAFSVLVESGRERQSHDVRAGTALSGMTAMVMDVWAPVAATLGTRVTTVTRELGIPTREEIADINRRLERLTASLEGLRRRH